MNLITETRAEYFAHTIEKDGTHVVGEIVALGTTFVIQSDEVAPAFLYHVTGEEYLRLQTIEKAKPTLPNELPFYDTDGNEVA